ncbi:MAG TPA: hypothetical protein VHX88_10020 [Solirubrobacteraceae bacterium]|nr:hypothetical protein [Solirubrobacteraceae bacterium]
MTEIARRDAKAGEKPAAYNEAYAGDEPDTIPYALLADIMATWEVPCTELMDPRFRDAGFGLGEATQDGQPIQVTLTIELGLHQGQRQPSTRAAPQAAGPHRIPAPPVDGPAVAAASPAPTASSTFGRARPSVPGARGPRVHLGRSPPR